MEFPTLGAQCTLSSCKQLDFLPMKCDACDNIYCNDHIKYEVHRCNSAYKKDIQVPVCPLCNKPVPTGKGESPDVKVGQHIDRDCQSDPAQQKRKAYTNRCSVKGCKQKELVPVRCDSCRQNFCLRHRHERDHNCTTLPANRPQGSQKQSSSVFKAGNAALSRAENNKSKPQQTSLTALGRDLDRARRERQQQQSQPVQQTALSEEEALRLAIQASLSDTGTNPQTQQQTEKPLTAQEQEDLALAQALAASEREEQQRRQRAQNAQSRQTQDKSNCAVS